MGKAPLSPAQLAVRQAYLAHRDRLPMLTIYDRPSDFPGSFVARLWYSLPAPEPTALTLTADNRLALCALIEQLYLGLTYLPRDPGDDPKIIGTFL